MAGSDHAAVLRHLPKVIEVLEVHEGLLYEILVLIIHLIRIYRIKKFALGCGANGVCADEQGEEKPVHIQVKVIRLPEAAKIRRFASRQLASALARFGHFVQSASLSLDDLNGPNRGGVDKHGRLRARLARSVRSGD